VGSATRQAESCTKFTVDAYIRVLRSSKDSRRTETNWLLCVSVACITNYLLILHLQIKNN
jgi:hypothetical protein